MNVGYKLMRLRADGTIGPLFINKSQVIPIGIWLGAEDHPTKGFAHRPGWHILAKPEAPHLSKKNRIWVKVAFDEFSCFTRPEKQGGLWFLANKMQVLEIL